MPDASWNTDPTGRHQLRFWDGSKWTEHVADQGVQSTDADLTPAAPEMAPPPAVVATTTKTSTTTGTLLAGGGAVGIIIGSFSPWATITSGFGSISVNGTQGDGTITLVLGVVAGVFALLAAQAKAKRGLTIGVIIAAGVAAAISFYDLQNVSRAVGSSSYLKASVGWGLYLCVAGAGAATAGGIVRWGELKPAVDTERPASEGAARE